MLKKIILLILICLTLEAKAPYLTNKDVKTKIEEILKSHASYKKITNFLAERLLKNFIDELDPLKTYFIESDIQKWLYPTDEILTSVIEGFKTNNFSVFSQIHCVMSEAIERRNKLEIELRTLELPKNIDPEEFKDITWTSCKKELLTRLLKIKSLQMDTAKKLDEDAENILKMLEKKRKTRENEIISQSQEDRKNLILSYLLKAFCHALDSHTDYFTPFEANQFMIQVQQKLSGIGAQLKDNLNGFMIMHVIDNSPAKKANLKIGDRIIAVNNEPVIGLDITEAVELIRGEKESKVHLTIVRKNEEENKDYKFDIELTRSEVVLEEARLETTFEPFGDGIIANIKLFSFYQDTKNSSAEDIKNALIELNKKHKIKAVLLDLRSNTGGLLPQAVEVVSLFISKGIVVSIKDCQGNVQHLRNTDGKPAFDGPLVVLINKASASASEIVAGTLQDYGRAIIVGDETSFGKGSFQTFTLDSSKGSKINSSGEYKVTRGIYYTVSGKSPQLTGIKSDITVPGILSELEIGEKFSKYPLENDEIAANFEDDLSDIPLIHRKRISLLYKHNLQQKMGNFIQYLNLLKANSKNRLENNKNYQNFLKEIKNKNFESKSVELFGQSDLQMQEALNIAKDLTYLCELNEKQFE
jgi:carboxyl-terminal processing protease